MQIEAGVDARIAQDDGFVGDLERMPDQRPDFLFGNIHQRIQVGSGIEAHFAQDGHQSLVIGIAAAGALAFERGIDIFGATFHGGNRIADTQAEVIMGMDADRAANDRLDGLDPVPDLLGAHRTGRVGHLDDVGAKFHSLAGLVGQDFRFNHMGHHEEGDRLQSQLLAQGDMLFAGGDLGAMQGDADNFQAFIESDPEIIHGAKAGHEQGRQFRVLQGFAGGRQELPVGMPGKAIFEDGAAEACAMADFGRINAARFQALANFENLVHGVLVMDGMAAIPQGGIDNPD